MSKKINRREFIVRGAASLAGLTLAGSAIGSVVASTAGINNDPVPDDTPDVRGVGTIDKVALGATGLVVSRMAWGTGTVGVNRSSNQTKLGLPAFTEIFRHGYDRGIRLADMAENYGSMPFVGEAMQGLPRESLTLLSKMWTEPDDSPQKPDVRKRIEDYLSWTRTDYFDILMLHCMTSGDWNTTRTRYMEAFSRAKEDGLVRCVGVSCHDINALRTAANEPWVDVIMARINPFGAVMDTGPEEAVKAIKMARENGKGVIGMKIFGEGKHVSDSEREQSLRFAVNESGIHALTIGFQSIAQMDDAIDRVVRLSPKS